MSVEDSDEEVEEPPAPLPRQQERQQQVQAAALAMTATPRAVSSTWSGGWEASATPSVSSSWAAGGGWERAFRHDDEMLRACGLWCKKVEADGACLFRAFSDQLEGDGGSEHLKYRTQCVTFLEAHRNEFAPFIETAFKQYCTKLREPSAWGGHVEAQALSRALGVNVLIHQPAEAQTAEDVPQHGIAVVCDDEDAPCVQVCFHPRYHSGAHYNSVRCVGDRGDGMPVAATLQELRERMVESLRARKQKMSPG